MSTPLGPERRSRDQPEWTSSEVSRTAAWACLCSCASATSLTPRSLRYTRASGRLFTKSGYKGCYKGVYPIKVNQQQQVVDEVTRFGAKYHHGLEAGSKAELIAAISLMKDPEACVICNGYKDEEFVDLGALRQEDGLPVLSGAGDAQRAPADT